MGSDPNQPTTPEAAGQSPMAIRRAARGLMCVPLFSPKPKQQAAFWSSGRNVLRSWWARAGIAVSGGPLNATDEDTFLALFELGLRQRNAPPGPLSGDSTPHIDSRGAALCESNACDSAAQPSQERTGKVCYFTLADLSGLIRAPLDPRQSFGGHELRERAKSLERLSKVAIVFRQFTPGRGRLIMESAPIRLLEPDYSHAQVHGTRKLAVRLNPFLMQVMEFYLSRIDWTVRRELAPLGKALHRAIAAQRGWGQWACRLETVLDAIGVLRQTCQVKYSVLQQLDRMVALDFLESAEIHTGRGLGYPKLVVVYSRTGRRGVARGRSAGDESPTIDAELNNKRQTRRSKPSGAKNTAGPRDWGAVGIGDAATLASKADCQPCARECRDRLHEAAGGTTGDTR